MALSNKEASIVLGMASRGGPEQDIAAYFGVNQGRVAEIKGGSYGSIPVAPAAELPQKGSFGLKGRKLRLYVRDAIAALEAGDSAAALKELHDGAARFDANET